VLSPERILRLQELVLRVPVADHVVKHAVALVRATRPADSKLPFIKENVSFGAGPRASQYLVLGAKAKAILEGRPAASVEDVRALAHPTLQHRIITNFHAEAEGVRTRALIDRLLDAVRP
jgi:MoxR-like ATPase